MNNSGIPIRVARNELPWVGGPLKLTPERVLSNTSFTRGSDYRCQNLSLISSFSHTGEHLTISWRISGTGVDIPMKMSDTDLQLLAKYVRHHAEDAFAELVRRHLDLVYSAALRQVRSPQ